jgi:hypothetical protein
MVWDNSKRNLYDNGLPFSQAIAKQVDEQIERVKGNKASLIIVDGGVGEGKTTLAVHLADYIQGAPINLKTQIGMGGNDFIKKFYEGSKKDYKVIVYDEAGDFDRRGAITRFNKMLNRIFDTYRTFNIIVILCLPNFNVLDKSIFEKQIPRLVFNCHNRSSKYGDIRAYNLYRMYLIKWWMGKLKIPPQAYQKVYPNVRGHFLDLPKERSQLLDKISTESKSEIHEEFNMIADGLLNYKDMANQLNMGVAWVKNKVNALGIEPSKTHKQKKFFSEDVLDILEKEIGGSKSKIGGDDDDE